MKYIGEELTVLPSLHDLRVDKIAFKRECLTLFFKDISKYDTIIYQNIKADELELEIELADYDFCRAYIIENVVLAHDDDFTEYKKEVKSTIYSINEFIEVATQKGFYMDVLDIAVSYKKLIIQTDSLLGECNLELSINSINFKWN